jgi:hypothetical protein
MLRIVLLSLLVLICAPALAVYKCESGGTITYSDEPCRGGKVLELDGPASGKTPASSAASAEHQAALDKREARRLEKERHQREAIESKEQQRVAYVNATRQKRCASLALQKKWSEEDAATATGRSADRAMRKAQRSAEKYEAECGKQ